MLTSISYWIFCLIVLSGLDETIEYQRLEQGKEIIGDVKQCVLQGLDENMTEVMLKKEADAYIQLNPEYKYIF